MKHVIVTGAARGIGYFFAEELLAKGYVVTVLDLEPERLAPLAEKFENLLALQCDVRNAQQIKTAVQKAISTFGPPVCAVHNACLCPFGPVEGTPETRFRDAYEVNTLGALRLSKAVLPYMKEQRGGRIIFTSSGVGVTGFADISPYASSKGAIESLAKCLAIECGLGDHIPSLSSAADAHRLLRSFARSQRDDGQPGSRGKRLGQAYGRSIVCNLPQLFTAAANQALLPLSVGNGADDEPDDGAVSKNAANGWVKTPCSLPFYEM